VTLAPDPQADFVRLRATDIGTMVPQLGKLFPDHGAICRIAGPTAKTFSLMIAGITLPA